MRELEQAGLDLVDHRGRHLARHPETLDLRIRRRYGGPKHDPLLLAPYLFAATSHIGIAPTVNAGAYPPYLAARQFATLRTSVVDRFGINVVTDVGQRPALRAAAAAHDAAYDRAEEWIAVRPPPLAQLGRRTR